jgi:tetratricopeptide (TPR) repeat protein
MPVLGGGANTSGGPEIRPDAPAEYDLLVAQLARSEGRLSDSVAAYERAVAKDEDSAYLHRKAAEALAISNRVEDALYHANRAYELDPDDRSTRLFLGQLYRLRRDVAGAERVLRDENGEPLDDSAAFLLYQIYLSTGRLPEALGTAEWWVASDPEALRARVALANAYQRLDRPREAEETLREALEQDPGNLRIYDALARSLRERGDRAAEIDVYLEVLDQYPRHHATLVALAEARWADKDLEGAMEVFEEIERFHPDDLRTVIRLGFLMYESGQFSEAEKRFEKALEANPEDYEIAFFLGVVRRRIGEDPAAIEAFEMIPPDHKNAIQAHRHLATIYEEQREYGLALAEIEIVLRAEPSLDLELYVASLRAKTGDFDGAIDQLEGLLNGTERDDEVFYSLGVLYGEAKRKEEALAYMQRALDENPDNANALNYVGYTWAEKGENLDKAESMIRRAAELRPDDGYIADSLGWVYYMRARPLVASGKHSEAQRYLQTALRELKRAEELTGGDPVISEHLGDTYLLLDEKELALERFEEAFRLEPREGEQPHLIQKLETLQQELR